MPKIYSKEEREQAKKPASEIGVTAAGVMRFIGHQSGARRG